MSLNNEDIELNILNRIFDADKEISCKDDFLNNDIELFSTNYSAGENLFSSLEDDCDLNNHYKNLETNFQKLQNENWNLSLQEEQNIQMNEFSSVNSQQSKLTKAMPKFSTSKNHDAPTQDYMPYSLNTGCDDNLPPTRKLVGWLRQDQLQVMLFNCIKKKRILPMIREVSPKLSLPSYEFSRVFFQDKISEAELEKSLKMTLRDFLLKGEYLKDISHKNNESRINALENESSEFVSLLERNIFSFFIGVADSVEGIMKILNKKGKKAELKTIEEFLTKFKNISSKLKSGL